VIVFIAGCNSKYECPKITVSKAMLDSVKQKADTSFSKKYRTEEFAQADYYVNRRDSTYCQIMKDTGGTIRQVIMAKKDIRFFTAEYFDNGQLKAKLPFDGNGKFDGQAEYYFENGCVRSSGSFVHGFFHGDWKNYNENGNLISIDSYNESGELINSSKK